MTADRMPTREIMVNWMGDGTFTGAHDDLTARTISNTLHVQYGRDTARPLGEPMLSSAGWDALNVDRLLAPEYAGSDLYGLIEPGKPTRIRMTAGAVTDYDADLDYDETVTFYDGAEILPVHAGILETPTHHPGLGQTSVSLSALGRLSSLRGVNISMPIAGPVRVDTAIDAILTAVGWPGELRDLAVADTTLEWFWMESEDVFEKLVQLQHSEGAPSLIWEGPDGVLHFENRNYRTQAVRSLTPQVLFSDHTSADVTYDDPIDYDADVFYEGAPRFFHSGVEYVQPFEDVRNKITQKIATRILNGVTHIWEYGQPLGLSPSESKTITVLTDDPVVGFATLQDGDDYTVTAGALAGAPTITNIYGRRCDLTYTAGPSGALVVGVTTDGPRLRASILPVVGQTEVTNTVDTSASITKYGGIAHIPRTLELQALPEINPATGVTLCDAAATYYADQRPIIRVRIVNITFEHAVHQLLRRPSDRITVVSTPLGLAGDFHIEQIEHRLIPEGLETIFICERALSEAGAGLWDDATWDDGVWGR